MDELLDNAPCGFLSFDDAGFILTANATLITWLGYSRDEIAHQTIGDILTVGAKIFYQTHVFPLLRLHGKAEEIYLSVKSKTGQQIPVFANAVRKMRDGMMVNDCIFVVVNQRNQYENEILAAKKAAELAIEEKTRAYEALHVAHERLEEQAIELEVQSVELEAQQEELIRLNDALEEDLLARRNIEKQLRESIAREAVINTIGRAVRESTSTDAIQWAATRGLSEALQTHRCFFTQFDTAHDRAWVDVDICRSGLTSVVGEYRLSDFDIDLTQLYTQNAPLVVFDVQSEDPASSSVGQALSVVGLRSALGVSLFDNGQLVAVLMAGMVDEARNWTYEDIALVQAVATQVRSAMETARVQQRERNIANRLQEALLPSSPDPIPGLTLDTYYRPALDEAEVGGDFYDVFIISQGCYALVVADVSGKGLEAASQIASIRHMLRAVLYQPGTDLAESVTQLNQMLAEHNLLSGFATLFVGLFDVEKQSLDYVSCGQEPGLIRRSGTNLIEYLRPTGPVLGTVVGIRFTQQTVHVSSGDVLALFTDGLTEAGLRRSSMLEIEGVEAIFRDCTYDFASSPKEITSRIMTTVLERVTPAGLRDDVCLLVACVG